MSFCGKRMENILICTDLVKQHRGRGFGVRQKGFRAVDGVSFSIEKKATFGLVGESGCGKTTLARAVMFLDKPTSGSVVFDNTDLGSLSSRQLRKFRKRMQIVFQDPNSALNPKLSVSESLQEGLINRGIARPEREKRIESLLDHVGISYSHRDRYPHEFSGGQKQRIVIARALTMEPDLLVLDEPVSNLDVSIQAQIINLLSDLKEEFSLTYLFISHDLNLVSYLSDTIAVMFKGKIIEQAQGDILTAAPLHPYTRKLFNSVPGKGGEIEQTGEPRVQAEGGKSLKEGVGADIRGCPYFPDCPLADDFCGKNLPALEEKNAGHVVSCFKAQSRG